jgi:ferrous iron transport protein B
MKKNKPVIALVGNPNSGKSSLFNQLTGLRQKVGNFPGVTVEKHTGDYKINGNIHANVVDLPGVYSLYPKSLDERVVIEILANPNHEDHPDVIVVTADASNLKRNLLLFTEVADLNIPVILALNMLDIAAQTSQRINVVKLAMKIGVPVVNINARNGEGLDRLAEAVQQQLTKPLRRKSLFFNPAQHCPELIEALKPTCGVANDYLTLHYVQQYTTLNFFTEQQREQFAKIIAKYDFNSHDFQVKETIDRYVTIDGVMKEVLTTNTIVEQPQWTKRLDKILLHPIWGYGVFLLVLLLIFQSVFTFSQFPMDAIDGGIATLTNWLKTTLPAGAFTNLLTDGLLAGIGGVLVFIPQIAFLFLLISCLEESGYMARVMVIMDKLMRRFGLNGKSVVPLISGVACAVPAIMATRSIGNRKERLITIFVTPFMSCAARLPIFVILTALVVPATPVLGFVTWQGLTLFGLYLLGIVGVLVSALLLQPYIANTERSYFVMEMPTYKRPRWSHVGISVVESVKSFVMDAGKIIVAISIVLWVLASYGPGNGIAQAETQVRQTQPTLTGVDFENAVAARKLENSYAGHFGKFIEPAIKPLGYDWKIGIALLTSFAAREVFVGTISTIYSIGARDDDHTTIKNRLRAEINPETGQPMYTPALAFSLLIFYVFAMMCMSTLATVYRETRLWRWPILQFIYMTGLAYLLAFITYQVLK